ncbi:MAG: efflux RND transporter permease subunit [bacterium]
MSTDSGQLARPNSRGGLIGLFSNHPVAANLLMVMMLLAGVWAVRQLNTQFFPSFDIDYASVQVVWSGASAEDVEELITVSLEQALRDVDFVKEMTSTSAEGVSSVTLEFEEGTDMSLAVDQVKQRIDQVQNLPEGADTPLVSQVVRYEGVARVLVTGDLDLRELRPLVNRFEQELLDRGIAKIFINGLPQEQIAIEIPSRNLRELELSLDDVGRRVAAWSRDVPVGIIGRGEISRQLRFQERRETGLGFETIPVVAAEQGRRITLGDIARIERKPKDSQVSITYRGKPAVELRLNRTENSDGLEAARILHRWLEETRPTLPPGVELVPFDERWEYLQGRISLLIKNGIGGLILVLGILYLFLQGRVAFWVAVGIPVSFMASLAVLYLIGGSINMISLFGLIMALGIIVDDAIVVGEEAMSHYAAGDDRRNASENAARRMMGPVFSSSLTTIAAFFPLLLIGGIIGSILKAIPVVVICVILASLVECFLILPGHLTHSFRRMGDKPVGALRRRLDNGFNVFRDSIFRPLVRRAIEFRWTTIATAVALLMLSLGWFAAGRIGFQFFPTAEADRLYANVGFVSGTSSSTVRDYMGKVEQALYEVEQDLGPPLINLVITRLGTEEGESRATGDHFGGVRVELVDPDLRKVRNRDIVKAWRDKLPPIPGRERLSIVEPRAGPPGSDIDLRIVGSNIRQVKKVAEEVAAVLREIPGVTGIEDDAPYGREQMVLELTPTAEVLGLSIDNVSRQLRAAYDGYVVQELSDGYDEIDVRLSLPEQERNSVASLSELDIILPNGNTETIGNLATISLDRGFETIRHSDGSLAVTVRGSVDPALNNANDIRAEIEKELLPDLSSRFGVKFSFEGRQADQRETLGDMRLGLMLALSMIYLVLSWVFGSYGWPLIVMFIIPFGLVGAIWGHVAMGLDLTILSLFGIFGLSGIVVNDSIILVVFYKDLRKRGMIAREAVVEAACQRLRAVILTSLTTIAGLTPLLFETSLQARFLIPMATSLAFGLAFATLLVLFLVPSLLLVYENAAGWLQLKGGTSTPSAGESITAQQD